jgi:glutathione synthase/RimK-type ligase-like ATP-grasp enzyme
MQLGLVTTAALGIVDDDQPLVTALARLGVACVPVAWDDRSSSSSSSLPPVLLMRSAWTSHLAPAAFLAWLASVPSILVNPPALVRWNLDKTYLRGLDAPLPRTIWLDAGARADLPALVDVLGPAVIKPTISASAYRTFRVDASCARAMQPQLDQILATGGAMVQAFVPEIETLGEDSLVVIGGAFTHAIRKRPAPGDFRVQSDFGGSRDRIEPPASSIALAERLVASLSPAALYARVDLVPTPTGPLLMELEAIDPELFFRRAPSAAARLADLLLPIVSAAS